MEDKPGFAESGYALVRELLPQATTRLCTAYAAANRDLPDYYAPETAFNAWGRYADSMGEVLLAQSRRRSRRLPGLPCFRRIPICASIAGAQRCPGIPIAPPAKSA